MPGRERRLDRAAWLIRRDLEEAGTDLRTARLAAGLTLAQVAKAVGVSAQTILRNERPVYPPGPHPEALARHAAAVGMRVRFRAYPEGAPLRDAAQLALLRQFRARLPSGARLAIEVPVSNDPRDGRARDAVLTLADGRCAVECVTRFHDCQAQCRQFRLKLRDGDVDRLILVVKATHANRRALSAARDALETVFPLTTRAVLRDLAGGRTPAANGIVLI